MHFSGKKTSQNQYFSYYFQPCYVTELLEKTRDGTGAAGGYQIPSQGKQGPFEEYVVLPLTGRYR